MAKIDSVYNYYLSTYGPKTIGSRHDSHKKSELRSVYNNMLKINKESPLYKINMEDSEIQKFVIDLKENARATKNAISDVFSGGDNIESLLDKKVAVSSNEDKIGVTYIGDGEADATSTFQMEVKELAKPQINTGKFLDPIDSNFEEGHFSFDLNTSSNSYEFQFNVGLGESNLDVQKKIARLVNASDVGLKAEVISNEQDRTAIQLISKNTGLPDGVENQFTIETNTSWKEVNLLGINNISSPATNSSFTLNGNEHASMSNTFTINKEFEITLKNPTDGNGVNVGFKTNTDALADGLSDLLTAYNNMVEVGRQYSSAHSNNQLLNEMTKIGRSLNNDLSAIGINLEEDNTLTMDREKLQAGITGENRDDVFKTLNRFKNALSKAADTTAINPMKYVDKLTVEYKNPGKNFSAVYASSTYAGLLVDRSL